MTSARLRHRAPALAMLVVAVALLAGCGDTDRAADVADGYTAYEGSFGGTSISFAYPSAWGEVTQRAGADEKENFFEVEGPSSDGTQPSVRVGVRVETASPEAILQANQGAAQLSGIELEVTSEEPVEVPGAAEALRAESTYGSAGQTRGKALQLVASTAEETAVSLIALDPDGAPDFDASVVADSLRIEQ